jgi:hypothetical protein
LPFLAFLTRVSMISQELGPGIALLTCIRSETIYEWRLLRSGVSMVFNSEHWRSAPVLKWDTRVTVSIKLGRKLKKEGLPSPYFKLGKNFQKLLLDWSFVIEGRRLPFVFSVWRSTREKYSFSILNSGAIDFTFPDFALRTLWSVSWSHKHR